MGIDLLKMPTSHQGSNYVLTAVDYLSKYTVLVPLQNKAADTVAKALVNNIFCRYNIPRRMLSDNGSEFRNEVMREIA
ncbi:DDE-type integrase/transposase/recombinase, partial [Nocardioides malaquae]|uniref:DDE-type integrase/transposase/recombinase n=1 Tax=Nocardioides malaquae TaxID=2773426 RepID=UPI0034DB3236